MSVENNDETVVNLAQARPGTDGEDAIALAFAERYRDWLRYVALWGRWMHYDDVEQRWANDDTLAVFDLVRDMCRSVGKKAPTASIVAAVEKLARADRRHAATADQWDSDPFLLGTPECTVDLRTGKAMTPRPSDYMTKVTSVGPRGNCPTWRAFLRRITNNDAELEGFIKRILGYSLTGSTAEHALFFLYGTGANGKSVLTSTVAGIMGDYHVTAPITAFVQSTSDQHPTDLAGLRGARLVTAIETEEGRRWTESKLKSITGGDRVSARFMRQDFFSYLPTFKIIIAGNHKPSLSTVDEAIKRRLHLIPFAVTIPEHERDKDLVQKLKAEWPGILAWMIEGCVEWQRVGLEPPEVVRTATKTYFEDQDVFSDWLEDMCEVDPWNSYKKETVAALFDSWTEYVQKADGEPGSRNSFSDRLAAKEGIERGKTREGRIFTGIKLLRKNC